LFEVPAPRLRDRHRPPARHGRSGLRAGRPAQRRRPTRPDVRPRPGDASPLHPGWHARQRLVRLALAARRQARPRPAPRRPPPRAGSPPLRRLALAVGPTPPDELERIIRAGGRLRPRTADSMGLIHLWARLASYFPHFANFVTQTPGLSALAKWVGGIAQ